MKQAFETMVAGQIRAHEALIFWLLMGTLIVLQLGVVAWTVSSLIKSIMEWKKQRLEWKSFLEKKNAKTDTKEP